MKDGFYNIIKGKFLVSDDALKNWRFIIFLSLLALIMIASSHSADKKVHQISKLNAEVKELKSEYVDVRMNLMQTRMESKIIAAMESRGLQPSVTPPTRIKIVKKAQK
ncbi:FtsL-like putative cell division protein [Aequorivita echinoideorum]|uniref:S-adenosyl-methyltransferase n=1 Tax=Aequorivita echinoideorum TaxID=1549647 RepID=A0ABS5S2J4_9FLAO|nr:FtsL-like putative cell division protein [Aequorivita echinoideorum]MBT0606627.1 S-adenosyl-methyltransferase [Aequorivita echinoideorum]